jgi:hypothetical protein
LFSALNRRPAFWLVIQPAVLLLAMAGTGNMAPQAEPDTAGYRDFDFSSLRAALSQTRTLGYPVLLRTVGRVSPSLAAVPYVQFLLHAGAVAALYAGLRRYGFAAIPAFAAASVLFYSGFVLMYVAVLLPDAAALSLAVLAIASLAAVVGRGGVGAWSGVVLFTALAYHFRPAYLFLVPLAPMLGAAMWWLAGAAGERSLMLRTRTPRRLAWLRLAAGLTAATVAPLLLFCGLRWTVVGHFGLVSFGGYNFIGITGQLLTPELSEDLPAHLQPLARSILQRSETASSGKRPGYFDIIENYNHTIWHVTAPAAQEQYGDDAVLVNERLTEISWQIIRLRPEAYIRWLLPAAKDGVAQLFEYAFLDRPGLILLAGLILCQIVLIARRRRQQEAAAIPRRDYFFELHASLLIALAFAAAKLALVILVEPPIHRYVAAAAIFLPMWPAIVLLDRLTITAHRGAERPPTG